MKIVTTDFVAGARDAQNIVVVIDVFRAFSVVCYCFMQGAKAILPAGAVKEALALKERYPGALLIGEREGKKLPGFDLGNSPVEVLESNLEGKILIHTTHAGTQGIVNAI